MTSCDLHVISFNAVLFVWLFGSILVNGYCVKGNDCVCKAQWTGTNCEKGNVDFVDMARKGFIS